MFPKADGVAAMLDAGLYDRQMLLQPPEGTFPLVVRMETITAKGEAEGHALQVGSSWPESVCCGAVIAGVSGGRCCCCVDVACKPGRGWGPPGSSGSLVASCSSAPGAEGSWRICGHA